jgi:hypothetical protein
VRSGAGASIERAFDDLLCLRFVASPGRDHRTLTFLSADGNRHQGRLCTRRRATTEGHAIQIELTATECIVKS